MNNAQPFTIERTYNAPVEKVWKALTDRDEMKKWYFDIAEFRAEPGFEFSFYGENKKGEKFLHLCRVLEVIPQKKLSYSWQYEGREGYSVVSFELSGEGDKTKVKLTHEGLESFPPVEDFRKENFAEGWTYIVGTALKEYAEK